MLALYFINVILFFKSNATIESYFSLVKIIKSENKTQIKIKETLSPILETKDILWYCIWTNQLALPFILKIIKAYKWIWKLRKLNLYTELMKFINY